MQQVPPLRLRRFSQEVEDGAGTEERLPGNSSLHSGDLFISIRILIVYFYFLSHMKEVFPQLKSQLSQICFNSLRSHQYHP